MSTHGIECLCVHIVSPNPNLSVDLSNYIYPSIFKVSSREQDQCPPQKSILLRAAVNPVSTKSREDEDLANPRSRGEENEEDEKESSREKGSV